MFVVFWLTVLAAPLPVVQELPPPRVIRMEREAKLAGNGRTQTMRLDSTSMSPVIVLDGGRTFTTGIRRHWRPWRVVAADIDGDGQREVIVALYKTTRYIRKPHNCLFVYRYDGREVYPRWLGSTLGRPFTDFAFGRLGKDRAARLVTLDIWLDGKRGVTIHRWTGFGFRKVVSWGAWKSARLIGIEGGRVVVVADGRRLERNQEERQ